VLAYPFVGSIGEVGEVLVSGSSEVASHTLPDEMKTRAHALYEQHREVIEAAFYD